MSTGESGSWSPMGGNGVLGVADRDFFHRMDATDVMSVDPDARQAHSSRIAHRQNQDSSVRPETSTLGTNTIREDALARLCPTSKRAGVAKPVTVITTWIIATGSEQKIRLNSILVCSVPRG